MEQAIERGCLGPSGLVVVLLSSSVIAADREIRGRGEEVAGGGLRGEEVGQGLAGQSEATQSNVSCSFSTLLGLGRALSRVATLLLVVVCLHQDVFPLPVEATREPAAPSSRNWVVLLAIGWAVDRMLTDAIHRLSIREDPVGSTPRSRSA